MIPPPPGRAEGAGTMRTGFSGVRRNVERSTGAASPAARPRQVVRMIPPPGCWPPAVAAHVIISREPRRAASGGASQVVG